MFSGWTPIHQAGKNGGPISWRDRQGIIHRLQDGLLIARAKLVVTLRRDKIYQDTAYFEDDPLRTAIARSSFTWGKPTENSESDVELPVKLWSSDKLGNPECDHWLSGEERLANPCTVDHEYEGDRATFYGIELRDNLDTMKRATYSAAVEWCADWLAQRRSAGLPSGENHAWDEFKGLPQFIGMSREDVFRPAFKSAKRGKT